MVSRVAAALIKFVKPIAQSGHSQPRPQGETPFVADQNQKKQTAQKPDHEAPLSSQEQLPQDSPEETTTSPPQGASVSHSFLDLLGKIRNQNQALFRWMAITKYEDGTKSKKKLGLRDKGAVLDDEAE